MIDPVHVLHVDDEPHFGELVAEFLQRENERFEVTTATSASEALQHLGDDATVVDCIVSDYDMPGQNGIEFLETVREEHPNLPFILYTGKGSEEVASDAISADVTDYLQKESGTEQYELLANRIRNAVERTRAQRDRQRHLNAIETTQEGISILNEDGEFIYVNEAYADLYGYDPEEMIGEHWELIYREEDVQRISDELLPTVEANGYWHGQTTGLRADDSTFVEDHTLTRTDEGELVCTVRDITEREEHKRRLETLIKNLPGMVYRCQNEPDWPMEFVSGECEALTGYPSSALETDEVRYGSDIIHSDDHDEVWNRVQESLDDREPFELTYRIITKDDTQKWVWERGRGIRSSDGDLEALEGFISDVTARMEYEEELELKKRAMDEAPVGILITDPAQDDNPIIYANDRFQQLTGYAEEEILGRNCRFLQEENTDPEPVAEMREAIDDHEPVTVELRNYRNDGSEFWNRVSIAPVENDDGDVTHFVGFQQDITEWKE